MTREEAITRLKNMAWLYGSAEREQNIEAIDMAIEALSAADRPKNMIHIYDVYRLIAGHSDYHGDSILSAFKCLVEGKDVKDITPLDESADRPTMDKEYLIDLIQEAVYDGEACAELIGLVDRQTTECYADTRPTGEWIRSHLLPNGWDCSHCDAPVMTDDISEMLFCPHCGAKMIGSVIQ